MCRKLGVFLVFVLFCFVFLLFLGPYPWHMEVARLGVKSELWLLAYTTAIATQDLSCICDLHLSSWQRWILNPMRRSGIEPKTSWFLVRFVNRWATCLKLASISPHTWNESIDLLAALTRKSFSLGYFSSSFWCISCSSSSCSALAGPCPLLWLFSWKDMTQVH